MSRFEVVHTTSTQLPQVAAESLTFARVLAQHWVPVNDRMGVEQDDPPGAQTPNGSDAQPTRDARMEENV